MTALPSWSAFEKWRAPRRVPSWEPVGRWAVAFDALMDASRSELARTLAKWDERLADLDGEPAHENWVSFRALGLGREEDWSDWLADLLERSQTGRFAALLFGGNVEAVEACQVSSVEREVVAEGYRADLVVRFRAGDWAHVEVKVGDLELAKTPATGAALRRVIGGVARRDYLLLPDHHLSIWESGPTASTEPGAAIEVIPWSRVASALRVSIVRAEAGAEPITWRVFARAFLGAIEQKLMGFSMVPRGPEIASYRPNAADLTRITYLEALEPK